MYEELNERSRRETLARLQSEHFRELVEDSREEREERKERKRMGKSTWGDRIQDLLHI